MSRAKTELDVIARTIIDLFDGEINIPEKEAEEGSEKFLKIKKMSN
jgi:hypothetical protein